MNISIYDFINKRIIDTEYLWHFKQYNTCYKVITHFRGNNNLYLMFCTCLVRGQVGHEVQVRHLQQEREPSEGRHGRVRPRAGNQRAPVS